MTERSEQIMSPAQCRAARALVGWTQSDLAARAETSQKVIAHFEGSKSGIRQNTRERIDLAVAIAGIRFFWKPGEGVCLLKP